MLSDYFFMHTQLCLLENYNHFWCYFDRCNQTLERAYANSGSELKKSTNCLRHIPKRQLRKMQICSFNFLTLYGSLCTKKKIFISHSRGFFLLLFKLHNTKNIQRERRRSKQGKVGAATTKKLKKMKFRVVVLWCSAQK